MYRQTRRTDKSAPMVRFNVVFEMKEESLPKEPIPGLSGRTIRCLLFDLGDTLWSRKDMTVWQRLENTASLRAIHVLRQSLTPQQLAQLPECSEMELAQLLRTEVEERLGIMIRTEPELEPKAGLAVAQVLQNWGIHDLAIAQCEAIFEAQRVRIPESRPLFDDVLYTLKTLQQRGFLLGIVSNRHWGGSLFLEDLQTLGLLEYFDPRHMAISVDLGIRKPNPAIFMHTLNALNVPPEEAVMVGDSLLSDIVGGKMLGLFSVWKPKPSVRTQANLISSGASAKAHQALTQAEGLSGRRPSDVPEGLHVTDDDYVLAHVQSRAGKWDEHLHSDIKPDLIIDNLSDLLDIFIEVGVQ